MSKNYLLTYLVTYYFFRKIVAVCSALFTNICAVCSVHIAHAFFAPTRPHISDVRGPTCTQNGVEVSW